MASFLAEPGVEAVAVCDIFGDRVEQARQKAPRAKRYADHRELLDRKDVDAVLIATPDHWHARIAIDAAEAGKDIYVEKPLTRTLDEGPKIIKAVRSHDRVCQVGLQQRSGRHYVRVKQDIVQGGMLGKVTVARTYWLGEAYHLRRAPESLRVKPANLDWARYLGELKWRDWDPQQYHNFRAYLDFGGGQATDLFCHWIDVVHMLLDQDNPVSAVAAGGIYHYRDGRTAPDTINVLLEYAGQWTATFDGTLVPGITARAVELWGANGRLRLDRSRCEFYPAERTAKPIVIPAEGDLTAEHVRNFLACMRTRQRPNADVWIGHRSAQAAHLGNLAYVQQRRLRFDPEREQILPL